jgi:hypothetical protein
VFPIYSRNWNTWNRKINTSKTKTSSLLTNMYIHNYYLPQLELRDVYLYLLANTSEPAPVQKIVDN